MSLTPTAEDLNRMSELKRKALDPSSFGEPVHADSRDLTGSGLAVDKTVVKQINQKGK